MPAEPGHYEMLGQDANLSLVHPETQVEGGVGTGKK